MKKTTLAWLCGIAFVLLTEIIFLFSAGPETGNLNVKDYSHQTQENGYTVSIDTKTGIISLAPIGQTPVPQSRLSPAITGMLDILPIVFVAVLLLGSIAWLIGKE